MKKALSIFLLLNLFIILSAPASAKSNESQLPIEENVIFLGDSTTNAMRHYEVLPEGKNTACVWGGVDGTLSMWDVSRKEIGITQAMYDTYTKRKIFTNLKNIFRQVSISDNPSIIYSAKIRDLCEYVRPLAIVITLGVNGCSCMSEDDFKYEYASLVEVIKEASPDTRIFLNSIYPVSRHSKKISNQAIDNANRIIAQVANDCNVEYIDTNSKLKGADGFAHDHLIDQGDGIHWNRAGYERIIELIRAEINSIGECRDYD